MKLKIYSGLSLAKKDVKRLCPSAEFSLPIGRSEIIKDIKSGVQVIGIIDGVFLQNKAVSPAEIMDALRCGVSVYGSSSMGAMRAAELSPYGMVGVGRIYEHITVTPYFRDDYLGQIFFENSETASLPFLDFAFGIEDAYQQGTITGKTGFSLLETYESLHFSERNIPALCQRIRSTRRRPEAMIKALGLVAKSITSTKRQDGLALLRKINADMKRVQRLNFRLK
jgi:hypothetical protein